MYSSYSSSTPGSVSNYPYNTAVLDGADLAGASVSQNFLCNGESGITVGHLTNNYESREVSNRTRLVSHKTKKDLEEEIAVLQSECYEKNNHIAYLKDKLSELEMNVQRRENEFQQKMEETLQQLTKVKMATFVANGNFLKKNAELEELKKELQTTKEREVKLNKKNLCLEEEIQILRERVTRMSVENSVKQTNSNDYEVKLNAMSSSIKEEVKILRERLGTIREEITQGSVTISQQAVHLQNLLSASKAGLTSSKGQSISSNYTTSPANQPEDLLIAKHAAENNGGTKQCQENQNGDLEFPRQSKEKANHQESYFPLFRAEDYFDPQPSEFDFLTNIVVENYPVRATSVLANDDECCQKEPTKAKGHLNPRPGALSTSCVINDFTAMKPLPIVTGSAISAPEVWNPHANPVKASGYLNHRPLPVNTGIGNYQAAIPTSTKASGYLNHRPLPVNSGIGNYQAAIPSSTKVHGGFFSRTFNNWFGF